MDNIMAELIHWTPTFAQGFLLNVLISLVAMLAGTFIGWSIALGRSNNHRQISHLFSLFTALFRNIPSFVFMFYIAFIIPIEFEWQGDIIRFPAWLKASIALTVPVIGFASDQFFRLSREVKKNNTVALPMFLVSWTQYFLIIIMASSTASVIGVHEIVGRANTAIAVSRDPGFMLWIYLYVAAWFLASAAMINLLLHYISEHIKRRYS